MHGRLFLQCNILGIHRPRCCLQVPKLGADDELEYEEVEEEPVGVKEEDPETVL